MWDYVKTSEDCQRMSFTSNYTSGLKAPLVRLLDIFSTDFAGCPFTTLRGMKSLLIFVEQLTGWPLACPTLSATALEVTTFIKQHIL